MQSPTVVPRSTSRIFPARQAFAELPPCLIRLPRDDASALFLVMVDLLEGPALPLPASVAVLAVAVQLDRQLSRIAS